MSGTEAADWPALTWKALETAVRSAARVGEAGDATLRGRCTHNLFLASARYLHDNGARLLTLAATVDDDGELILTYAFEVGASGKVLIRAQTENHGIDSLFSLFACADFLEREVNNLFGIKFLGHPNLSHVDGST